MLGLSGIQKRSGALMLLKLLLSLNQSTLKLEPSVKAIFALELDHRQDRVLGCTPF